MKIFSEKFQNISEWILIFFQKLADISENHPSFPINM